VDDLSKDVGALEGLVETLLGHVETAISHDVTAADRNRLARMVAQIRMALDQVEEPEIRATHLVVDGVTP
jgi:hypothetical protein